VQDGFFDRVYWEPSVRSAENAGLSTALGVGVVYDSCIHGSWPRMRDRTTDRHGDAETIGEQIWVAHYLDTRREWLANHSNPWLPRTVYRMDALGELAAAGKWSLELPFTVRGVVLTEDVLTGEPAASGEVVRSSAEDGPRLLRVEDPLLDGEDVRRVQEALRARGAAIDADGVYGPQTAGAVTAFQRQQSLVADGIVGPATRDALGLAS
jgi:chitosanase